MDESTLITPRHNLGIVKSIVSPEDIRPFPKAPERKLNAIQKGRKKGRTRILTDTPEKNEAELNKKPKTITKPTIKLVKKKSIRKKLKFVTNDESSEEDCENHKIVNDDDDDIINEIEEIEEDQREEDYLLRIKIKQEDHDEVTDNEIVRKLPLPILNGGSERQISQISFSIDFSSYILG
ncbi:hypothetical protein QTP88_017635 [Uroleucon formosanum]